MSDFLGATIAGEATVVFLLIFGSLYLACVCTVNFRLRARTNHTIRETTTMIINHAIIALLISSSIRSVPMTAVAEEVLADLLCFLPQTRGCHSPSCLSRAICREEREATDASIATLKLQELIPVGAHGKLPTSAHSKLTSQRKRVSSFQVGTWLEWGGDISVSARRKRLRCGRRGF